MGAERGKSTHHSDSNTVQVTEAWRLEFETSCFNKYHLSSKSNKLGFFSDPQPEIG